MATALVNGLDVAKLVSMVEAVKQEPPLAALKFHVRSEWKGGLRAQHTAAEYAVGSVTAQHVKSHTVYSDEPREVLGADAGISPAEIILSSLGACLAVGYAANAAAMGINLDEVSLDVTADGDLQGFMNLNDVRPGLSNIAVKAAIKADAPREKLQELHDYVNAHSPMWDTIARPVSVQSVLAGA